jgi:flagellar hook-length control protein FliK
MQTTNLPIQFNTTVNASAAAQRSNAANAANAASDASQFSAMLSSQLAQTQAPAPAPAPAPQAPAAQQQNAANSAQTDQTDQSADTSTQQASSTSSTATTASTSDGTKGADASAKTGDKSDDDSDKSTQPNPDPANAMLALIASLQHPGAKTATAKSNIQSSDALGANGGKTRSTDASQLAALQGALKSNGKDSAAADAKDLSAASKKADLEDAGASDKAASTNASSDLSALSGTGLKGADKSALEAADLSLQQARDAAQQATQQDPTAMAAAALAQTTQPAALEAAQAASASEQLSAQVGTDAWENQVGQKVVYMLGNEEQTASLTLNPPDLGPMQVVLSVSNDQANVTFSSNQLEVRQALENALPRLREMMSESGIALGNATVNAGTQDQRQAQQDSSSRGGRNYGSGKAVDGVSSTDTSTTRVARTTLLNDRGMVDTFA